MKILTIPLALFVIGAASCKKSQSTPSGPVSVSNFAFAEEALDYAKLPLDRYFIYKDSVTANIDSVQVTQSALKDTIQAGTPSNGLLTPSAPGYGYQKYSLTLTKLNGSTTTWFQGQTGNLFLGDSSLTFWGNDNIIMFGGSIYGYGFSYSVPFDSSNYFSHFTVENNIYDDVISIGFTNGTDATDPSYFKSTYYWAKGVGIIKRTVKMSSAITTSFLQRYGN